MIREGPSVHENLDVLDAIQSMRAQHAFEIGSVFTWDLDEASSFNELSGMPENARGMAILEA